MLSSLFISIGILFLFVSSLFVVHGDKGYYLDSDATVTDFSNINLLDPPIIRNDVSTSFIYDSGTEDTMYITYVGTFSNSGPHALGSFARGSIVQVDVPLDRKIGELVRVLLQTNGTDSWLMATLQCTMGSLSYELRGPRTWLEALNVGQEEAFEDGFSAASAQIDLPSASNLLLSVSDKHIVYTSTGIVGDGP